jgi:H+/Cl- antiporter ClcA
MDNASSTSSTLIGFIKQNYFVKWLVMCIIVGIFVGSASALFLASLSWVTDYRENHQWIIWLLPLAGLVIGLMYHNWGREVERGNDLIIEQFEKPDKTIPLRMAPFVLIGTLLTHLFGGSAGREGTAVQMGGAIADSFTNTFKLSIADRQTILVIGVSAGFASVFGTPLAGAVFALEVMLIRKMSYQAIFPSFLIAFIADFVCHSWGVPHTAYHIPLVPEMTLKNLLWTVLCGILFGWAALLFSKAKFLFGRLFALIGYAPIRPILGGIVIALTVWLMGTTKYIGLGVPTIVESFSESMLPYDFMIKLLLTAFTLGAGFKGGEVTPLFFIGATLGNVLIWFVPLPVALLAGMGFVAVFSGATNTPIACTLMGMELFGLESGLYIAIACIIAFLFSGKRGVYSAQFIPQKKYKYHFMTKWGK